MPIRMAFVDCVRGAHRPGGRSTWMKLAQCLILRNGPKDPSRSPQRHCSACLELSPRRRVGSSAPLMDLVLCRSPPAHVVRPDDLVAMDDDMLLIQAQAAEVPDRGRQILEGGERCPRLADPLDAIEFLAPPAAHGIVGRATAV